MNPSTRVRGSAWAWRPSWSWTTSRRSGTRCARSSSRSGTRCWSPAPGRGDRGRGRLKPDLVVLDLMLPDLPGEEVARSLRAVSEVPIIMLTAKAEEADRVAGLRLGADDYVVKPFSPLELVARVDAVLRRARAGGARRGAVLRRGAARDRRDGSRGATRRRTRSRSRRASSTSCSRSPRSPARRSRATSSSPGCTATTTRATSGRSTST